VQRYKETSEKLSRAKAQRYERFVFALFGDLASLREQWYLDFSEASNI
jgi:hypothetical protein